MLRRPQGVDDTDHLVDARAPSRTLQETGAWPVHKQSLIATGVTYSTWVIVLAAK
jgi:hypothetical protein